MTDDDLMLPPRKLKMWRVWRREPGEEPQAVLALFDAVDGLALGYLSSVDGVEWSLEEVPYFSRREEGKP